MKCSLWCPQKIPSSLWGLHLLLGALRRILPTVCQHDQACKASRLKMHKLIRDKSFDSRYLARRLKGFFYTSNTSFHEARTCGQNALYLCCTHMQAKHIVHFWHTFLLLFDVLNDPF